jgi:hypothetical protein
MKKFRYEITIEASAEKEALVKMQAVVTLVSKLTAQELDKLAYIVKHDPVKLAMAKNALGV